MSRYLGPRIRILRRLGGYLPAFCSGKPTGKKGRNTPGQHGKPRVSAFPKRKKNESPYSLRLKAKQRLRFNYHITERQLFNYVKKARKIKGPTGKNLLILLEMRLDNIVYRMGLARTIIAARQYVNHEHITVNNKKMNIPSYNCNVLDTIRVRNKPSSRKLIRRALIPYVVPKPKISKAKPFKFKPRKGKGGRRGKPGLGLSDQGTSFESPFCPKDGSHGYKNEKNSAVLSKNNKGRNKGIKKDNAKDEKVSFEKRKHYSTYRIPKYLNVCRKTLTGVVKRIVPRKQVRLRIEELLVVEYYSRG